MAIRSIKEIIQNRAYLISPSDRKIFEEGTLQSFFGLGDKDVIEFIIYDLSDNQLPQENGGLVRYIPMTTENIGKYILIPEGTILKQYEFPTEYFIDAELLIREAGYSTGVFKTQTTLLNKRVGSEQLYDKVWITEISPSRTEIRVEPLKKGMELNPELLNRFNLFIANGDFRDDTIYFVPQFLAKINSNTIDDFIKSSYGSKYFSRFLTEYSITDFDRFCADVYETFVESAMYEFTNRYSTVTDINYGKPKTTPPQIELTVSKIVDKCKELIVLAISYHLANPIFTTSATFDNKTDSSDDAIKQAIIRLN